MVGRPVGGAGTAARLAVRRRRVRRRAALGAELHDGRCLGARAAGIVCGRRRARVRRHGPLAAGRDVPHGRGRVAALRGSAALGRDPLRRRARSMGGREGYRARGCGKLVRSGRRRNPDPDAVGRRRRMCVPVRRRTLPGARACADRPGKHSLHRFGDGWLHTVAARGGDPTRVADALLPGAARRPRTALDRRRGVVGHTDGPCVARSVSGGLSAGRATSGVECGT